MAGVIFFLLGDRALACFAPRCSVTLIVYRHYDRVDAKARFLPSLDPLESAPVPDPWGNPVRLAAIPPETMSIDSSELFYSVGPNGLDELGEGDDVWCNSVHDELGVVLGAQAGRIALCVSFLCALAIACSGVARRPALVLAVVLGGTVGWLVGGLVPAGLVRSVRGEQVSGSASAGLLLAVLAVALVSWRRERLQEAASRAGIED